MVVGAKSGSPQLPPQQCVPRVMRWRSVALLRKSATQYRDRLRGDPHRFHAVITANLDDQPSDAGMKVHVLVGVHMVERQTGCSERCELRPDLALQLTANCREDKKSDAGAGYVPVELAVLADELRDLCRMQNGMSIGQVQMQADMKLGQMMGAGNRIGRRRAPNHQARGRQDPMPMRFFDGLVDSRVETKIVGANDQPPQLAISRLRRNWKNSTPSRRRRRSICGLLTISATSEAILFRRK
jgi:hypothetical protein